MYKFIKEIFLGKIWEVLEFFIGLIGEIVFLYGVI